MSLWKYVCAAAVAVMLCCVQGCGGSEASASDELAPAGIGKVTVANGSSATIKSVLVQGIGHPIRFKPIAAGSRSTLQPAGDLEHVDDVSIRWTDTDGNHFSVNVELHGQTSGNITLTVRGEDRVTVSRG